MTRVTAFTELDKAIEFGQENNLGWRILQQGPNPNTPFMLDGFIFLEWDRDRDKVPEEGKRQLELFAAQFGYSKIERVLIAHPEPEFLPEGQSMTQEEQASKDIKELINGIGVAVVSGIFLAAIGVVLVALVAGLALLLLPALIMMGMAALLVGGILVMTALGLDPWLVAVVEIEEGQLYAMVLVYSWIDDEHATGS